MGQPPRAGDDRRQRDRTTTRTTTTFHQGVAITGFLMVRAQVELAQSALIWLTGSLASTPLVERRDRPRRLLLAPPAVVACARWLPSPRWARATAASLGVSLATVRIVTVIVAVLLTSTRARSSVRSRSSRCAPRPSPVRSSDTALSASARAPPRRRGLLAGADLIAQYAIPGISLPVGVVTGALGAVFLLWLLTTSKGRQL